MLSTSGLPPPETPDATNRRVALLEAIAAEPDDDAPRLVYADFLLEETGERPRGELIQVQCQLERMSIADPRRSALTARASELDRTHAREWLVDLWDLKLPHTKFGFRRGFVEILSAPFAIASMRASDLLSRAPLLSVLNLTIDGQLDRLELSRPRDVSLLTRATVLSLKGLRAGNTRLGQGPLSRFSGLASIPFERLRALTIAQLRVHDPRELAQLLASESMANLDELRLKLVLGPASIEILDGASCRKLRRLDVGWSAIGDGAITFLATSGLLRHVTDLDLSGTEMTTQGLAELLQGDRLASIERFAIGWNPLDEDAVRLLATWEGGQRLEQLLLRGTPLSEERVAPLLRTPRRQALRSLVF